MEPAQVRTREEYKTARVEVLLDTEETGTPGCSDLLNDKYKSKNLACQPSFLLHEELMTHLAKLVHIQAELEGQPLEPFIYADHCAPHKQYFHFDYFEESDMLPTSMNGKPTIAERDVPDGQELKFKILKTES